MRAVTISASFLVAASAVVASPALAKRQAGTTATYVADIATCPNITRRDVSSPSVHVRTSHHRLSHKLSFLY